MRFGIFLITGLMILACATPSFSAEDVGQQDPWGDPQQMDKLKAGLHELQAGMYDQVGPAMGSMMENMMVKMFQVMSRPEVAEGLATFTKNYYDALLKKGFTKEEALRIVVSVGMPSVGK